MKLSKVIVGAALLGFSCMASAHVKCEKFLWFDICQIDKDPKPRVVAAPEIDPASAMTGLTLLAGGLVVLRGRREKILKA